MSYQKWKQLYMQLLSYLLGCCLIAGPSFISMSVKNATLSDITIFVFWDAKQQPNKGIHMFMKWAKYVTFRRTKLLHVNIAATAMHEKGRVSLTACKPENRTTRPKDNSPKRKLAQDNLPHIQKTTRPIQKTTRPMSYKCKTC